MKHAAESSSVGPGSSIAVRWRVGLLVGAFLGLSVGLVLGRLSDRRVESVAGDPGAGAVLREAPAATLAPPSQPEGERVVTRAAFEAAAAERALLETELELLREEVDALRLALAQERSGALATKPSGRPSDRPPDGPADERTDSKPWFDDDALAQAGFAASEIEHLRERWEQFELDKLYLADKAEREKAEGKRRQPGELAELRSNFRDEVGESGYDAYLYATGKHNRVVIREVLQNSPAMHSGLEQGDVVLRYEGERIYRPRELQRASRKGVEGEVVRLEVLRHGSRISVTLARGPLGVRMEASSMSPERY
ncbi:MAG: PDZ domain-containing protein [Deltaproteobacteria bacterium]|nr:PDZ domain-containing protein [Deltaproteobacteria bacterium]MBW2419034.1 PDZ domain-containing protein [Deltaproteobacteria bacterium]